MRLQLRIYSVDSQKASKPIFEMKSASLRTFSPTAPENPKPANKKVFVVHGHDSAAREQLELIIHKLGLDPFVLQNTGGGELTIIEALEQEIGPQSDAARFGIVLLTPDDVGYSKFAGDKEAQPRARKMLCLKWEC
jgi:predicted nucleotide-binding protein